MWSYNLGLEFEKVVEKFPKRLAFRFQNEEIPYQEFSQLANQLARVFLSKDLSCGDRICITSKKTITTYAAMMGCLKIGVTYSFVDRFSPFKRLAKILDTCRPKCVIADQEFYENVLKDQTDISVLLLEELKASASSFETSFLEETHEIPSTTIAYIMFTSGSSGNPKGVAIPHQNLIQFKNWGIQEYSISHEDILTNVNPLFFDNSVFDLYMSMFSGACLLPLSRAELKDPTNILQHMDENNATVWFSVPSLIIYLLSLHVLKKDNFKHIRKIIFGGEGFPKNKLKELYDLFGDRAQLINVYGPTECTCICSSYLISDKDFEGPTAMGTLAPLGHIARHFYYLILDEKKDPVTPGEVGELYLGGMNVGSGYWGNLEESQRSFVQNPLNKDYRAILYRTGDLVRCNPGDRKIFFCGRKDRQIKVMGYRIELEEIEAALNGTGLIHECAVTYGRKNGYDEITGFVVSSFSEKEIRAKIKEIIPSYMVPRKIIHMDSLPQNTNGKIDWKKLSEEYYDKG
ncbi:amino acid adenylation domain-containing protein [Acidobacteria bacterium AH-259-D05]|nr:amino acid adenylation domain-containing protein [Acidobacteria bacterium AH-259-D05]